MACSVLLSAHPVSALADSRSTPASVDFSPGTTTPVPPVDPDRPGREPPETPARPGSEPPAGPGWVEPITVTTDQRIPTGESGAIERIAGATGAAGWLSINYVTPLHYNAEIDDGVFTVAQERPYLQTSDLRGTASGWKVTAIAGPFHDPETMSPVPVLLSFCHGSPNSAYTHWNPPDIPDLIELPANGHTQRLVEVAHENEGVGVWVARWYPEHGAAHDFQLKLFAPVAAGRLGSVLWMMNDAP